MPENAYYLDYLKASQHRMEPKHVGGQTEQAKQVPVQPDSPTLGNPAAQDPPARRGQGQPAGDNNASSRTEIPPKPPGANPPLPLLLDPRSFMNPRKAPIPPGDAPTHGGMLGREAREVLRGTPPSQSSAAPTAAPNFSRKPVLGPKPPTR